ncbi:MAG: polysaccharide biosynthesis C-terminal domain-containing protein [Streptococcaceae bacterium]|jgi:putative MATE family efflux protein|nr:polysaccharide biosynthesis C-terminal domain-containing protein [Streptococcaceae bacterium]
MENSLTQLSTWPKILRFALPAIAENALQTLMGFVDVWLVARVSLAAVSGVSLANGVMAVYLALFVALGAIISGRLAGQSNLTFIASSLKLTALISVILGLLTAIFAHPFLQLLGAHSGVLKGATLYLTWIGGLVFVLALMTILGGILRAKGDTKTPMFITFGANILNILISGTLILMLHWGVAGAITGTLIARFLACVLLVLKLYSRGFAPTLGQIIHVPLDAQLFKQSLPAMGERLAMRAGDLIVMALIITFSPSIFAGNAIGETLTSFNYAPLFGLASITVILVGQQLKQNNPKAIKRDVHITYWLSSFATLAIGAIVWGLSSFLNPLFTTNAIAQQASTLVIIIVFASSFLFAGTVTYTAAFQGLGKAQLPFIATLIGMFVVRIGGGFFLGHTLNLQLLGVQLAIVLDNVWRFGFLAFRFRKEVQW